MPRRRREHQVEALSAGGLAGFEGTLDHADVRKAGEPGAGGRGQRRTELHTRDPVTGAGEGERGLVRRAAHLEQRITGLQPSLLNQGLEQPLRSGPVEAFGECIGRRSASGTF
jgi:hypothetical protein